MTDAKNNAGTLSTAKNKIRDIANKVKGSASMAATSTGDAASRAAQAIKDNPGITAAVAGAVVAAGAAAVAGKKLYDGKTKKPARKSTASKPASANGSGKTGSRPKTAAKKPAAKKSPTTKTTEKSTSPSS
jgi:hypothetical protein